MRLGREALRVQIPEPPQLTTLPEDSGREDLTRYTARVAVRVAIALIPDPTAPGPCARSRPSVTPFAGRHPPAAGERHHQTRNRRHPGPERGHSPPGGIAWPPRSGECSRSAPKRRAIRREEITHDLIICAAIGAGLDLRSMPRSSSRKRGRKQPCSPRCSRSACDQRPTATAPACQQLPRSSSRHRPGHSMRGPSLAQLTTPVRHTRTPPSAEPAPNSSD